ncbi:glycosyltransferase [Pseudonocardia sp. ICBG162]|uniref:glycosyltransferase n=1 Tax=Pseudonocardia sp. ICBG162 TaxID=2846761 RepID=UPI001CF6A8BB|nr:glycosyltransferase [Pseudonocardia sp. ICBG162]
MRRLDVLVLGLNYPPEVTGIAPYTGGLARALAGAGHRVHVVAGFPHYPQWRIPDGYRGLRRVERDGEVRLTRVRQPVPADPTGPGRVVMEAAFAAATCTVRTGRSDAVVVVSPALLTVAAALLRSRLTRGRPPVGVVVQDVYGAAMRETGVLGGRASRLVGALERALLDRADRIVCIHDTMRDTLVRAGVRTPVDVIRNWSHVGTPSVPAAEQRARLGWRPGRVVALHAGNMGAKQGLENVVAAARLAQERDLPIEFVLLGDGSARPGLERLAAGCDRISFLSPLAAGLFESTLAAADVLVLNERASVREMCVPSKLTSYFAAARPVVAASAEGGATAFEIRRSGGGVVVAPERPDLLLDAALGLGLRPGDTGERGRTYAGTELTPARAETAYRDWVDALAARARPVRTGTAALRHGGRGPYALARRAVGRAVARAGTGRSRPT